MPDIAYKLAQAHWPGALTLVVPAARQLPPGFRASDGSIALRAPDNAIVQGILAELGQPLATSSANLQGMPPASSVQGLDFRLAQDVDLIIDGGPVAGGLPSTIVSCLGQRPLLLREGAIPAAALMLD
jgi:tRNA threonylcarbamoyl adenosine modification protein (Sua5/YciO/YrdC/YwlC family)